MSAGHIGDFPGSGSLNERIFDVMDNIEYRRVTAIEDFEAIGRLRAQAFDARFIYPKKMANSAVDEMDFTPNAYVYGMYHLGELVSTVRIHVVSRKNPQSVSARLFPNTLKPLIDQGMTFIDSTRFAVDEEISHSVPGLPLLTLRIPMMAMTYFNADTGLALIKEGHAPFYRRVFRATLLAGPEQFDTFAFPAVLFQSPHTNTPGTCRRYPMFYSTAAERRMMFDKSSRKAPPLTILPTAKLVEWAA